MRRRVRSHRQGQRDRADSWESIFVQITLGFVIILGYMISDNRREVASLVEGREQLASEIEVVEEELSRWRDAYVEVLQTPQGALTRERDSALEELQLQRLLRAWDHVRESRRLRELLRAARAGTADFELAEDADRLPQGPLFDALQEESRKLFATATGSLAEDAVPRFVEQVFTHAAESAREDEAPLARPAPGDERPFDARIATPHNVEILKDVIRENLLEERSWLIEGQFRLVRRVMEARIDWLTRNPGAEVDAADHQLASVVAELAGHMQLLDEVRLALTRAEP